MNQDIINLLAVIGGTAVFLGIIQIAYYSLDTFLIWFGCPYGRPTKKIPMYRLFGVYISPLLDSHIKRDAFFIGAFARPAPDDGEELVFQPYRFIQGKGWTKK